jgi:hypothetical protein
MCLVLVRCVVTRVRDIAQSDCWLRHVCPTAHPPALNTARIFMKFDMSIFGKVRGET